MRGYLDESQKITLRTNMGTRKNGTWAASTAVDIESRQNGKGGTIQARKAYGLICLNEKIIFTAHEVPTATQMHLRLVEWLEAYDDLRKLISRVTYGNGTEGVEFIAGGSIKYKARTGGGARGYDEVGTLFYDEVQHAKGMHVASSSPTMAVHPNPQGWFAGSGGFKFSEVAWNLRKAALAGRDPRLGYCEHTAEQVSLDAEGNVVSVKPDPHDKRMWAIANPAYNVRISDDFLTSQLSLLGPQLFAQEHLCVWDALEADAAKEPPTINPVKWAEGRCEPIPTPARLTLGVAVGFGGEVTSITMCCAYPTGGVYGKVIENTAGSAWLPGELVRLVQRRAPVKIGLDDQGPSSSVVPDLKAAFVDAGLDYDELVEHVSGIDYAGACASLVTAIDDGAFRHPGDPALDLAVSKATKRTIGDRWAWKRQDQAVPIAALEATTIARALWLTIPPETNAGDDFMAYVRAQRIARELAAANA